MYSSAATMDGKIHQFHHIQFWVNLCCIFSNIFALVNSDLFIHDSTGRLPLLFKKKKCPWIICNQCIYIYNDSSFSKLILMLSHLHCCEWQTTTEAEASHFFMIYMKDEEEQQNPSKSNQSNVWWQFRFFKRGVQLDKTHAIFAIYTIMLNIPIS